MWFWYFAVFLRAYCCIMISFISTFVLGPNADILNYRRRQFLVSYQNYAFSSFWCSAMPAFLTTLSELETVCKVQKSLYLYTYVNGICRLNKSYTSAIWVFMSTKWDAFKWWYLLFFVPLQNFSLTRRGHHCRRRTANFDLHVY